ncbi:MAG: glycoside hydrolase family 95-like protein, partial [bacterium]
VVIHFGHNNVWDIRIAENNKDKIGTFQEIFEKVKAIPEDYKTLNDDPWYREYRTMTRGNYAKPYPRPFPCGSLLLGFDRRGVELVGHRLDIATGLCEVNLLIRGEPAMLQIFTEMKADRLWMHLVDRAGQPLPCCFDRIRLIPDPETPKDIPQYGVLNELPSGTLSFRQVLPFQEPDQYNAIEGHPKDRAFRLSACTNASLVDYERINWEGNVQPMGALERGLTTIGDFVVCVQLDEGLGSAIDAGPMDLPIPDRDGFSFAFRAAEVKWREYWNRSGVVLSDKILEKVWYWNHYFFNCSVKEGVTCPGLFANWSYRNIGTAWHGDYHMNYNTQQPFWMPFSSNRVEKHLPYVDLVNHLLPISRKWAKEYYGLRGVYFPHSAYPVEMNILPYPVPTWGWEICETPWTVQSLWWHYLYTMDTEFLRTRAFGPIKEAVLFLVDYMKRPEAHNRNRWKDDNYHIFPTVPPELYGLRPGFQFNYDCLVDLTLTKFVFRAYLEAISILGIEESESDLTADVHDILNHFPEYPTAESDKGKVFVSVPGERADVVYNVPNSLMTVFPGEEHGLHSPRNIYTMLENTYRTMRIEGGNELVFLNLQAARIGLLDLERFKRQIEYCLLPNGTCADMVLQVHGRYTDNSAYDFMKSMGIWFENFALPLVLNECLLQSYNGVIRLFPNWPKEWSAEFQTLRTVGAFLVSASIANGQVQRVDILSEAGAPLKILNPWERGAQIIQANRKQQIAEALFELETQPGESIRLLPLQ